MVFSIEPKIINPPKNRHDYQLSEAIRLTGAEISELTDNIDEGVKSTRQVVQGVDRSLGSAKAGVKSRYQIRLNFIFMESETLF